jgi:hypothetical protein
MMFRKGQTVTYNGVEYRLTLKGRIYAAFLNLLDRIKRLTRDLKEKKE